MQTERSSQHIPQEIQVINLVPEHAVPAMHRAIIDLLHDLPTPITITTHKDTQQKTYYSYQVGAVSEQQPLGIARGATPHFLDAMRFSLEAAMQQTERHKDE